MFDCCDQLTEVGLCILNCQLKGSFTETCVIEHTVLICNAHHAIFFLMKMCMKPRSYFCITIICRNLDKIFWLFLTAYHVDN